MAMSVVTLLTTTLVPVVSVVSSATVAIWTKRLDARNRQADRQHALILDYEKRAGEEKKAVLKSLILATLYLKRGAEHLVGTEVNAESISRRRAEAIRELYEFRARLGLDDGIAELMIYASAPVRDLTEMMLDEWDRQFRENGYSLAQLDACKQQLLHEVGTASTGSQPADGERKWAELKCEEAAWLQKLGDESQLDLDTLVDLCLRILKAAHTDLRGGFGIPGVEFSDT